MIKLRPEQEKIASYDSGCLAVPAVPGAGKTTTLAALAARLIAAKKHQPGKILIVTCMNSAVANFKSRIAAFLKEKGMPGRGYEVKTLHSLAVKILRRYPDSVAVGDDFQVLDEYRQNEVIRSLAADWIARNEEVFYGFLDDSRQESHERRLQKKLRWEKKFLQELISGMLKSFKGSRLDDAALSRLCACNSLLKGAEEIYHAYRQYLAANSFLDFDDLILKALKLLETNSAALEHFQSEWSYIFEDEAQDSNPMQERLLYLLSRKNGNLVRVGDLNQSIMGTFTLSEAKLFRRYCERAETEILPIYCSSRSAEPIISLANSLVSWIRQCHPESNCRGALEEQIIALAPADDPFPNPPAEFSHIVAKTYQNKDQELEKIADFAANSVKRNPDSTVAILVPYNTHVDTYVEKLESLRVNCQEISKCPKERRKVIRLLGSLLDYLSEPDKADKFLLALTSLGYLAEETSDELYSWLKEIHLEELLYPLGREMFCPDWLNSEVWFNLLEGIDCLKGFLALLGLDEDELILHIGQSLNLSPEDFAIVQRIAYEVRVLKKFQPDWRLGDLAAELKTANNNFNYFANLVYERQGYKPKAGEVTVCTYHKAKGLEWDIVYLTNIDEWIFPSSLAAVSQGELYYLKEEYRSPQALVKACLSSSEESEAEIMRRSKEESIAERIRLLYVGITRAKKNLCLSGSVARRSSEPSLYLRWVKNYLKEKEHE